MSIKPASEKVECLNPNTGGSMYIGKRLYDLFSKAIYHILKKSQPLTYSQMLKAFILASVNKKPNLRALLSSIL